MSELITESELQKHGLSAEALLNKFKEQVLKDFEMCNVHMHLQEFADLSYEAIRANLSQALKKIIDSGYSNLQSLLYRIDIQERQFEDAVRKQKNTQVQDVLADLVIKRILQKVILKLIYSK